MASARQPPASMTRRRCSISVGSPKRRVIWMVLAIVRTGSKRITYATAFGALVLSLPFFAAALVI